MTDIAENSNTSAKEINLLKFWEQEVLPRLTPDLVYDHPSHAFQRSSQKWRGGSPFRESKSGTSFAVWPDTLRFYDSGCEFAGDPIAYIHSIKVNRWEHPKAIDWVEALREAASRVGVTLPEREHTPREIEVAAKLEARRGVTDAAVAQALGDSGTRSYFRLVASSRSLKLNPNSASVFNPPHPKGLVLRCQFKRADYTWLAWTDLPRFSGSPFASKKQRFPYPQVFGN